MIGVTTYVAFTNIIRWNRKACLRWSIAFGLMILIFTGRFAQVGVFGWWRWPIIIFETTLTMSMSGMCTSLLAREAATVFAKTYFSFAVFIAIARFWLKVRFRFEIRSVCSVTFFVRTISSVLSLFRMRMTIVVVLICQNSRSYLSDWWMMEDQDPLVLYVDLDIAQLFHLSGLYGSKFIPSFLVTSFCKCLFIEFTFG